MVLQRFGLKTSIVSFWSGIGYGFQLGNYGRVRTYLLFQLQMSKKERKICKFEMDFTFFVAVLI